MKMNGNITILHTQPKIKMNNFSYAHNTLNGYAMSSGSVSSCFDISVGDYDSDGEQELRLTNTGGGDNVSEHHPSGNFTHTFLGNLFVPTVQGEEYTFRFTVEELSTPYMHLIIQGVGQVGTPMEAVYTTTGEKALRFIANAGVTRLFFLQGNAPDSLAKVTLSKLTLQGAKLTPVNTSPYTTENYTGDKRYELSNHLGNVLQVITDRKLPVESTTTPETVDYYTADVVAYNDYYPYGMQMPDRHGSEGEYSYGFNGMEKDDEVKGKGNSYDFGARLYDSRVGRWLSRDKHAKNYPDLSSYNFAVNNPLIYIDPDGNDIVYFDSNGKEVKRTKSDTRFGARVDLKGDGNYSVAPMPNIIKGYEDPKYQQYDYIIAAETHIFNNLTPSEKPKAANGLTLDGEQPVKLSPTLVKAIIVQETQLGNYNGSAGQNGYSDIMQANVTTSNGETDWNDNKSNFGLKKNESATPQQSVHAGIRILFAKGLITTELKFNGPPDYSLSEDSQVDWRGGSLNSWWEATKKYNGRTDIVGGQEYQLYYVKSIFKNWRSSSYSQDPKYYIPNNNNNTNDNSNDSED